MTVKHTVAIRTLINFGSGNGLPPYGAKPLPEPAFSQQQTWIKFNGSMDE